MSSLGAFAGILPTGPWSPPARPDEEASLRKQRPDPSTRPSLLWQLIQKFGWKPTLAVVALVAIAMQFVPNDPNRLVKHRQVHGTPGPLSSALDHQLESWRL